MRVLKLYIASGCINLKCEDPLFRNVIITNLKTPTLWENVDCRTPEHVNCFWKLLKVWVTQKQSSVCTACVPEGPQQLQTQELMIDCLKDMDVGSRSAQKMDT